LEGGFEIERHQGLISPNSNVYTSRSNSVTLNFHSDWSGTNQGFRLIYRSKFWFRKGSKNRCLVHVLWCLLLRHVTNINCTWNEWWLEKLSSAATTRI